MAEGTVAVVACESVNTVGKGKLGHNGSVEKRGPATGTESILRSQGLHSKARWRVLKKVRMSDPIKNSRRPRLFQGNIRERSN